MKLITVEVPETVNLDKTEVTMILAAKLYERGELSSGQAAEMAGYSKRVFLEKLSKYNVALFHYNPDEIETDIANAAPYHL